MFIPLDRKPDWRHPPVVTLLLICINVLIFNFMQNQDQLREADAFRYYFASGLAELEIPRYIQYLNKQGHRQLSIAAVTELETHEQKNLYAHMMSNGGFQQALRQSHIISAKDPNYELWQGLRKGYNERLKAIFTYRYALKPYAPDPLTIFSSLFLHADVWHLLGNMFFLLLFGFILELALGSIMLLLVFVSCGIIANLLTLVITPGSAQWLVGASGAITGLAGLYTLLYGMQKVRFFYSLIFYFDYVRAPAIIMLPIWLLYELAYSFIAPNSVSTVTHVGGLLGGLFIGAIIKYSPFQLNHEDDRKNKQADFDKAFQDAMKALSNSDLNKAKDILEQLLKTQPENPHIILKLFHIAKARNNMLDVQYYIQKLLAYSGKEPQLINDQQRSFEEYLKLNQGKLDLPVDILVETAIRFCRTGFTGSCEKILIKIFQQNSSHEKIPVLLLMLATHYDKSGDAKKSNQYKQLLIKRFANSYEAQTIQQTLPEG